MRPWRIVFMGTPDFSVPTLKALKEAGHEIAAVFTQPDKERGRGKKVTAGPVKKTAEMYDIPVFQPTNLRTAEVEAQLRQLAPDVIIVIAYGKILPPSIVHLPMYGCLNVHASLLPKYRGAAPIQYAIKEGDTKSGVTIMRLDEGLDTGKILKQAELSLDAEETTGSLFTKLATLGARTLTTVLADLPAYEAGAVAQEEAHATYTAKITKDMAALDWRQEAIVLERWIRTLDPSPGAYTQYAGKRLKIWSAQVVPHTSSCSPGTVIAVDKAHFTVQTGNGALRVLEVQPESRKRMKTGQFLQGTPLRVGEVLK
ncbi:methionyl-tRNA formyltransferase [uncultured Megasphaera sp.]|uniref:methionyl-tRNA formyltransferase n=1 Tax=uncultured Megasphaera sp. TaxID=165188 RepID=UPI00259628D7|nr:methionyl-tRNA formyltransferase [uncultured Megasphaera sp.]